MTRQLSFPSPERSENLSQGRAPSPASPRRDSRPARPGGRDGRARTRARAHTRARAGTLLTREKDPAAWPRTLERPLHQPEAKRGSRGAARRPQAHGAGCAGPQDARAGGRPRRTTAAAEGLRRHRGPRPARRPRTRAGGSGPGPAAPAPARARPPPGAPARPTCLVGAVFARVPAGPRQAPAQPRRHQGRGLVHARPAAGRAASGPTAAAAGAPARPRRPRRQEATEPVPLHGGGRGCSPAPALRPARLGSAPLGSTRPYSTRLGCARLRSPRRPPLGGPVRPVAPSPARPLSWTPALGPVRRPGSGAGR